MLDQLLRVSCIILLQPPSHPLHPKWELTEIKSYVICHQININSFEPCFKYTKIIILITANEEKDNEEKRKNKKLI